MVDQLDESNLAQRVRNLLYSRPELRKIEVAARAGTITLQGTVSSFYERQLCISGSKRVSGVFRLIDEIEVSSRRAEGVFS